jgi:hypothetical protein
MSKLRSQTSRLNGAKSRGPKSAAGKQISARNSIDHGLFAETFAEEGNRFVAALAREVFIAHAAPSSRTFALCEEQLRQHKPLITIHDLANGNLLALPGGRGFTESEAES